LTIGSGMLEFNDFNFTALTGFGPGTYTLFDTSAAITGSLGSSLSGSVGGFSATLSLADGGNDVVLTVVPEPTGMVLAGMGLLGMIGMARASRRYSLSKVG
jgi:hypothetical protein